MTNSQIDEAILSVIEISWKKVAMVIDKAETILGNKLPDGDGGLDLIARRIEALVQDGSLLAQGDIKNWRHSEVRKPS